MLAPAHQPKAEHPRKVDDRRSQEDADLRPSARFVQEARPAHSGEEPGDVRGRGRCAPDHGALRPRSCHRRGGIIGFSLQIILWLWFTVLFANFAEAVAEGRGKAQAASLRATKTTSPRKKLPARSNSAQVRAACSCKPATSFLSRRAISFPSTASDRGRRLGERSGHHGRVGARDPRVGRRPRAP